MVKQTTRISSVDQTNQLVAMRILLGFDRTNNLGRFRPVMRNRSPLHRLGKLHRLLFYHQQLPLNHRVRRAVWIVGGHHHSRLVEMIVTEKVEALITWKNVLCHPTARNQLLNQAKVLFELEMQIETLNMTLLCGQPKGPIIIIITMQKVDLQAPILIEEGRLDFGNHLHHPQCRILTGNLRTIGIITEPVGRS